MSQIVPVNFGDSGEAVTAWQNKLNDLGFPVIVDGSFGPATDDATRALQRSLGITVDGQVGQETIDSLSRVQTLPNVSITGSTSSNGFLIIGVGIAALLVLGMTGFFNVKKK